MNILYDLFYGELSFCAADPDPDPEYRAALAAAGEAEAALLSALSGRERELLLALLNAQSTVDACLMSGRFVQGFRAGGRMMAEVLRQ